MRHVRVRLVRDFCVIPNAMSQSCGLSPSGLGLAAYISSMPDDAPVGVKPLADRFRVSQQQIAEGLRELVFAGLLARDRVNLPDGRLCTDVSFTGIPGGAGPSRETLAHQLAHKGVRYSAAHRRRLSDILACRAAARRRALAAVAEAGGWGGGGGGSAGEGGAGGSAGAGGAVGIEGRAGGRGEGGAGDAIEGRAEGSGAQGASAASEQRPAPLRRPVRAVPKARPRQAAPAAAPAREAAALGAGVLGAGVPGAGVPGAGVPGAGVPGEVAPTGVTPAAVPQAVVPEATVPEAPVPGATAEAGRLPVPAQAAAPRRTYVRPVNQPVPDTISTLGNALAGLIPAPAPAPAREWLAPGWPAVLPRTPEPAPEAASEAASGPASGPAPQAAPGPAREPAYGSAPGRAPAPEAEAGHAPATAFEAGHAPGHAPGAAPGFMSGAVPEAGPSPAPASGHAPVRDEDAPPAPELDEAVRLLASLRRVDPRLVLGARDVGRLAPTVAAWLAAGVHPDDVVVIVSGGLPQGEIWHPAGFVARRLGGGMPPPLTAVPVAGHDGAAALREAPAPRRPLPFVNCTCCDRAIRGHRDTLCPECAATGCRPTGGTGSRTSCPNRPKPAVGTEPRPRRWGWQPPRWS